MKGFLASEVQEILSLKLGRDSLSIGADTTFLELGVDSSLSVDFLVALNERFGLSLGVEAIFDYIRVMDFVEHVVDSCSDVLGLRQRVGGQGASGREASALERANHDAPPESQGIEGVKAPGLARGAEDTAAGGAIDDLAIIGLSVRFPGAEDANEFWSSLYGGRCLVREVVDAEHRAQGQALGAASFPKAMALLEGVDLFDAEFFGLSPDEASAMDPQQRIVLEEAWRTIEDAGYSPEALAGRFGGVFIGVMGQDYSELQWPEATEHSLVGNTASFIAGRVADFLDLKGTSLSVDAACSSTLVALHQACSAVRSGDLDFALVGGVSLCLTERSYLAMQRAAMLSASGQCRPFDDRADGFVPGEGAGMIMVKRLTSAIADRDNIYAVIKGIGVGQTGRTNGVTAPSSRSQAAVQKRVHEAARIDPGTVSYVEAHGSGTRIGDAIELAALTETFRGHAKGPGSCAIGSVKANIGHLSGAAGMAALAKVLLCLRRASLVPSLNFSRLNGLIDLESGPFYVNTSAQEWSTTHGVPRRAAINSFGFSGTNCYAVLEEYTPARESAQRQPAGNHIVTVSARSEPALHRALSGLRDWLRIAPERVCLADVAYTLNWGRRHFSCRRSFVADGAADLLTQVNSALARDHDGRRPAAGALSTPSERHAALDETARRILEDIAAAGGAGSVSKQKLVALAEAYNAGASVDWHRLYRDQNVKKTSLPTYPFIRSRFWQGRAAWPEIRAASRAEAGDGRGGCGRELVETHAVFLELERHARDLLLSSFQRKSLLLKAGERYMKAELQRALRIDAGHARLYEALLEILLRERWISLSQDEIVATAAVEDPALRRRLRDVSVAAPELLRSSPGAAPYVALLRGCLGKLWEIMSGEDDVMSVLFPDGSLALLTAAYAANGLAIYSNEQLAEEVCAAVEERLLSGPGTQKLRILEIGAGTGATSRHVLDKLARHRDAVEFWYTDVSPFFTRQGAGAFGDQYRFVTFRELDIERDIAAQGFDRHYFDIVLATNVLHATTLIRRTLDHVHELLKPGGLLALCELTKRADFLTLIFGLTNGWWSFEDGEDRIEHSPLLQAASWTAVLRERGFRRIRELGGPPGDSERAFSQTVILASAPEIQDRQGAPAELIARSTAVRGGAHRWPAADGDLYDAVVERIVSHVASAATVPRERIDLQRRFADYGLKSKTGILMIERLAKELQVPLRAIDLFNYPAIGELARYISSEHRDRILALGALPEPAGHSASTPGGVGRAARADRRDANPGSRDAQGVLELAVIGMSGRFPGANNVREFWSNLAAGRSCITRFPDARRRYKSRLDVGDGEDGVPDHGGYLDDVSLFDPLFFHMSGVEAELTDPQHRLFLEECWKAIEDAGYNPHDFSERKLGVFVGAGAGDYRERLRENGLHSESHAFVGNEASILASRIAYFLNAKGPCLAVDTACSSSLVAVHLACQSLASGESEVAIAGGAFIMTTLSYHASWAKAGMLARDGRCKAFDDSADGFIPGEAVVAIVLKPLARAVDDGDFIYGVIKASGVNQDGKTNGITAPSGLSQAALINNVYERASIAADSINYIEAHGTGTRLGDPIEVDALSSVFRKHSSESRYCGIGSVKTNVGHTIFAAGLVGLVKVLLALRHGKIPPSLNVAQENTEIDFARSPFYVTRELSDWAPRGGSPRRAAVSSFGISGTNAHLVVEDAPPAPARRADERHGWFLVTLSAKTDDALRARCDELVAWLDESGSIASIEDVSYTSNVGRSHFSRREAYVAVSLEDLAEQLRSTARLPGRGPGCGKAPGLGHERDRALDERAAGIVDELTRMDPRAADARKKQLSALAELYVTGASISWQDLYAGGRHRRLQLPGYPFARESYWVPGRQEVNTADRHPALSPELAVPAGDERTRPQPPRRNSFEVGGMGAAQTKYYRPVWIEAPLSDRDLELAPGSVVILDRTRARFDLLKKRLRGQERTKIIWIRPGERFRDLGDGIYEISPQEGEGFEMLLRALSADVPPVHTVLHCWNTDVQAASCERDEDPLAMAEAVDEELETGAYTILRLTRALLAQKRRGKTRIISLYQCNTASSRPHEAAMAAFAKSLRVEESLMIHKVVAMERDGEDSADRDVRVLLSEIGAGEETDVIYRKGSRWTRSFERIDRNFVAARAAADGVRLKRGGVCIVTGGAGELGLLVGEYMMRRFEARLVLVGRSHVSQLSLDKRRRLSELDRLGTAVYQRADVRRLDQLCVVVEEARRRFGRIDGVIHAAGVLRDGLVAKKQDDVFKEVVETKLKGALFLDALTARDELDVFIMFSSLASIVGNEGQSDHGVANAFLDRFAELRADLVRGGHRYGRTLSASWPLWAEGGTVLAAEQLKLLFTQMGMAPMPNQEGLGAFADVLRLGGESVAVFHGDAARFERLLRPTGAACPPRAAGAANGEKMLESTIDYVKKLICGELRLPLQTVSHREVLETYGVDSLVIRKLNAALEKVFGPLPKSLLFEYKTIEDLSAYLVANCESELKRLLLIEEPAVARMPDRKPERTSAASATAQDPGRSVAPPVPCSRLHGDGGGAKEGARYPIAIVGISGRFPMADNLDAFWRNLAEGKDCVIRVPRERWDNEHVYDAAGSRYDRTDCNCGGFLSGYDEFDPLLFNVSPSEARTMDPQERLLLQAVWSTLEDAGYTRERLNLKVKSNGHKGVGTYIGITSGTYQLVGLDAWRNQSGGMVLPEGAHWTVANRVSYTFGFTGPSMPVDTACSASLVAMHLACEAIRNGECGAAVVGGVNLYLHPYRYVVLSQRRLLSRSGRCRSFGDGADGFVPGEAVGAVLLKPLHDAIADGDHIYGVVKATAVGYAGRTNGYAAPDPQAYARVASEAIARAGIDPRTISYIEAQAVGSDLGDSIEVAGLTAAFRRSTEDVGFCTIGSLKPNIGHAESAADIAKLAKVLLQFKHGTLAPTIVPPNLSSSIDFATTPFVVQDKLSPWSRSGVDAVRAEPRHPRRAAISSLGGGGALAHLIVEEWVGEDEPGSRGEQAPAGAQLIVLSARTQEALRQAAENLAVFLEEDLARERDGGGGATLRDISYTLMVGREAMSERLAVVATSKRELADSLSAFLQGSSDRSNYVRGKADARIRNGEPPVRPSGDLRPLAAWWCLGGGVDWDEMVNGGDMKRVSLPTYPFAKERYWLNDRVEAHDRGLPLAGGSEVVADYYNTATRIFRAQDRYLRYITLAPLPAVIDDFSWLVTFSRPESRPEHLKMVVEKQEELRRALFWNVDFNKVHSFLDIGCGLGTDLVEIAESYVHARGDGYTIARKQFEFASQDISNRGLSDRVHVHLCDSSQDPFPGQYDLIYGIEVCHHIKNKNGLYSNVASHLRLGGLLNLADTIARTSGDINNEEVGSYSPTEIRYSRLLATNALEVIECIDVSEEIANFLEDARFEDNLALLGADHTRRGLAGAAEHRAWNNYGKALRMGLVAYVLLSARKVDPRSDLDAVYERNLRKIQAPRRYADTPKGAPYLRSISAPRMAAEPPDAAGRPNGADQGPRPQAAPHEPAAERRGDQRREGSDDRSNQRARCERLEQRISSIVSEVLEVRIQELEIEARFADYGVDSLRGLRLVEAVNRRFGLHLPMEVLFDHSSIRDLSVYLLSQHQIQMPDVQQERPETSEQARAEASSQGVGKAEQPTAAAHAAPARAEDAQAGGSGGIAVIGIACQFPGARNRREFWTNLTAGVDAAREVPADRWDPDSIYDPDPDAPGKSYSKWGGFLDGAFEFDPLFFNISPKEATLMDPQQRLLLQQCWHALEDAGYSGESTRGLKCGVFVGVAGNPYQPLSESNESALSDGHELLGHSPAILASRISYFLDLKGPAIAVDTACSSSLVALHLAQEQIRSGQMKMALVGGVTLYLDPRTFVSLSKLGLLSSTGKCRPFDEQADGVVVGEGVGVILIKDLAQALADGDSIYGMIKGSAINQDGRTNGITAPSKASQVELELETYRTCGISPETISYVEAHGTGTRLGDPIEVNALIDSFRSFTDRRQFCALGSVKGNIGHTTAAAGMAGLIKILSSFEHRQIPPSLNFDSANRHIDLAASPFFVNTELRDWIAPTGSARRAALSSFGWSGTNAHVVVEEVPTRAAAVRRRDVGHFLIVVSGKTRTAALGRIAELKDWLTIEDPGVDLGDAAYTLSVGRSHFRYRVGIVVKDIDELVSKASELREGKVPGGCIINLDSESQRGAEPALRRLAHQLVTDLAAAGASSQPSYADRLLALADLYVKGYEIDWPSLYEGQGYRRVHLPGYPFARDLYHIPTDGRTVKETGFEPHCLDQMIDEATVRRRELILKKKLGAQDSLARDHVVNGRMVLPISVGWSMAMATVRRERPGARGGVGRLRGATFLAPLVVERDGVEVEMTIDAVDGWSRYEIRGSSGAAPVVHSRGELYLGRGEQEVRADSVDLKGLLSGSGTMLRAGDAYAVFEAMGLTYGGSYRLVEWVRLYEWGALGRLATEHDARRGSGSSALEPRIVDAALQVAMLMRCGTGHEQPLIQPFSVDDVEISASLQASRYVCARIASGDARGFKVDVTAIDESGKPLLRVSGLRALQVGAAVNGDPRTNGMKAKGATELRSDARSSAPPSPLPAGPAAHATHDAEDEQLAALLPRRNVDTGAAPTPEAASRARMLVLIQNEIRKHLGSCIGVDPLQLHLDEAFADYGVDSIVAMDLVKRINDDMGIQLKVTSIFDYSGIGDLARHILASYEVELSRGLGRVEATAGRAAGSASRSGEADPLGQGRTERTESGAELTARDATGSRALGRSSSPNADLLSLLERVESREVSVDDAIERLDTLS
ncbi:SDR family NAD(P)-dependent oxidoreductase [Sorangium sp. So ce590]|uniref:SDR family NAD(P)-dependent oxidoreductase n=1 Tax=Sorangium sp. So ce590 TaxID=3133317 RepID=UPI003F607132